MTNPICIIDDDPAIREALSALVRSRGLTVEAFTSADEYLQRDSASAPACLIVDVDMPGRSGLELQEELARMDVAVPLIFLTGYGTVPMSVQAMKAGAVEFLLKPLDGDRLLAAISQAVAREAAETPCRAPLVRERQQPSDDDFEGIVGASTVLRGLLQQVETVAVTDATVLIRGETGTGKELIARALHNRSDRRNGPFVKINCAAIPAGLLESELMGHEKGAFTGAVAQRIGRFERAQNGTLFLDEIGEMPIDLQPKLLRLLQEREFERVGGSKTLRSNARLVAATHRDLAAMVERRTFREDLFYRLSVFPVETPPLRARREDIPALARHFVRELATRMKKPTPSLSPEVIEMLMQHDWPGNVRELQNVLERAVILTRGPVLELPVFQNTTSRASPVPGDDDMASVRRAHILRVLSVTNWVVAGPRGAAARLGMKRSTLLSTMKRLGITKEGRAGRAQSSLTPR
jgi:DNA-binding NtrC family response regulator